MKGPVLHQSVHPGRPDYNPTPHGPIRAGARKNLLTIHRRIKRQQEQGR